MRYSIKFYLTHQYIKNMKCVRVRVTWNKNYFEHVITDAIDPDSWDNNNECIIGKSMNIASMNKHINRIRNNVDKLFVLSDVNNTIPSLKEVKESCGVFKEDKTEYDYVRDTIVDFYKNESIRLQWKKATVVRFKNLSNHLIKFNPELRMNEFDDDVINDFITYLYNTGLRNSTVDKNIRLLKWFLHWAKENKYIDEDFQTYKIHFREIEQEPIFLSKDELKSLYEVELNPKLSRVRDVFIFCCFTGLRFSDVAKLTKDDIKNNRISIITTKTDDYLTINLNQTAKEILDRYKDISGIMALPVISNQKSNDFLKEIGKMANINSVVVRSYYIKNKRIDEHYHKWELLTTHCARRTFISQALSLGVSSEIVMKITGHNDLKAMRPYIAIVEESKKEAVDKLDNLLK